MASQDINLQKKSVLFLATTLLRNTMQSRFFGESSLGQKMDVLSRWLNLKNDFVATKNGASFCANWNVMDLAHVWE